MSTNATATGRLAVSASSTAADAEKRHRVRLYALYALAIAINLAIFIYGFDYYRLSAVDRPFSPKHHVLRPSGPIGLYLGFFGVALFMGIFLYPIRKHWPWLAAIGSTRHWLDIHILMGLTAPAIVAFHSSLKFKGLAGMAFWIMFAVSASGVVGRYLYGQIPRKVTTAELSMRELQELQAELSQQLTAQNLLPEADLRALLRLPDANRVPAVLYVVARSVDQGRRAGLASPSGIATGTLAHVLAASLGLSALLVSSAVAYSVVKYAGAAYLFYLGIKKFRERPAADNEVRHLQALALRRVYAQGVLVNVLNPKTAIFFFAFLPQFVDPARGHVSWQFLALGMLFTVMGLTTDSLWALTAGSAAG